MQQRPVRGERCDNDLYVAVVRQPSTARGQKACISTLLSAQLYIKSGLGLGFFLKTSVFSLFMHRVVILASWHLSRQALKPRQRISISYFGDYLGLELLQRLNILIEFSPANASKT